MDDTWMKRAACRGYPMPEYSGYWFTDEANSMPAEARRICASCPVLDDCRNYVMAMEGGAKSANGRDGNWAGMTPLDRARLYRTGTVELPARRPHSDRREPPQRSAVPW